MTIIPAKPEVSPFLGALVTQNEVAAKIISEEGSYPRVPFFVSDDISPGTKFGHTFVDPDYKTISAPPVYQTLPRPGLLAGTDGIVLFDTRVLPDTIAYVSCWLPESLTKTLENHKWIEFREPIESNRRLDGPHFCGFAPSWRNYAHWLNESVPRLHAFLMEKRSEPSLKVLLPALAGAQADTVSILGIAPEDVVTVAPTDVIECERLCTISAIDLWTVPRYLRRAVTYLGDRLGLAETPQEQRRSLYIHRGSGARQLLNFDEIRPILNDAGFEIIDFDGFSLAEQITCMRSARFVIGEHGAGLANCFFMPPGGAILELFNDACVQPEYWSLASLMGHRYGYLVGASQTTKRPDVNDWNAHYQIDPARLATAVKLMRDGVSSSPTRAITHGVTA